MLWIDNVPSLRYQSAKVRARTAATTGVVIARLTPYLSVRMSV